MYPFFTVFGRNIPAYGTMLVTGIGAAVLVVLLLCKITAKDKLFRSDILLAGCISVAGAMIGGYLLRPLMKLPEVIIKWEEYSAVPAGALVQYLFGELVFFGGLIGAVITIWIWCKKFKIPVIPVFDYLAPAVAAGHAVGRIGCLLGGCCYGMPLEHGHPLAVVYPPQSLGAPPGIPLLAVPVIESVGLLAVSAITALVYIITKRNGTGVGVYLILYSVLRFGIEFFRGDMVRGTYGWFTTSQIISIALFSAGVLFIVFAIRRPPKKTAGGTPT
jgi:phosphatidylglycerol:prolipoprotein diacylglycerol transferase